MAHKVHLHHNDGAACGAISLNTHWPRTVGRVVWPAVVKEYKCKACDRLYRLDKLGTTQADNRPDPHPLTVCLDRELST